ncbi:MAG: hypothetical protein EOP68_18110 [Sphingomonas sp.]|nr:MAG: hypothetical protein EOP68_18110 [Sphingomonas sp.]
MTDAALIRRETAISVAINIGLSIAFYVALFGLAAPAAPVALGRDCVPQAFMVTLMGTLVPGLLTRREVGGPAAAIVVRAIGNALAAAVLAGGGALLLLAQATSPIAPTVALAVKAVFGGVLAAIVTPAALRAVLARRTQP